jgi:hypothetical protein
MEKKAKTLSAIITNDRTMIQRVLAPILSLLVFTLPIVPEIHAQLACAGCFPLLGP